LSQVDFAPCAAKAQCASVAHDYVRSVTRDPETDAIATSLKGADILTICYAAYAKRHQVRRLPHRHGVALKIRHQDALPPDSASAFEMSPLARLNESYPT